MKMDRCQRRRSSEEEKDAISNLPEDLLCHILSFLSTREAALTSVLSKRWRYLFTMIPSLDFDDSFFIPYVSPEECPRTSFIEFVSRVLALQSNSPITKFSLTCHQFVDKDIVEDWILKALRRGATDLTLIVLFPSRLYNLYSLPSSIVYNSHKLIKLRLGCGRLSIYHYDLFRGDFAFTNLRILHLDSIDLGPEDGKIAWLLSKCPMLEELIVNCIKWHRWSSASVCSRTLKRLTIDGEHYLPSMDSHIFKYRREKIASGNDHFIDPLAVSCHFGTAHPRDVSFDTPNLLYLNYSDFLACNYPLVKLDSLVEARLDVGSNITQMRARDSEEFEVRWDATNLIMGIQNVQTLHLTSATLEVIEDFCKTIPVFHNLNYLLIESDDERGWQALPLLLINCPNLQTLVFHGLHHRVTDGCGDACDCISLPPPSFSCLSSCPVKILKILEFGATCREMSLVEHFFKNLRQLEQVIIVLQCDSFIEEDCDHFEVSKALEMVPRASPNCKLKVVNIISSDDSFGGQ